MNLFEANKYNKPSSAIYIQLELDTFGFLWILNLDIFCIQIKDNCVENLGNFEKSGYCAPTSGLQGILKSFTLEIINPWVC